MVYSNGERHVNIKLNVQEKEQVSLFNYPEVIIKHTGKREIEIVYNDAYRWGFLIESENIVQE